MNSAVHAILVMKLEDITPEYIEFCTELINRALNKEYEPTKITVCTVSS